MHIREARVNDAAAIARIYSWFVENTAVSFEEEAPATHELERRIGSSIVWLVAEIDNRVIGYGYASEFHPRAAYRWSAEVSVYIGNGARGRGVGRALLTRLLDDLRDMGYVNAFAGIALPNDASVALFESFGFERMALQRKVGYKLGRWHDVGWWQLQLREPVLPPPEILPTRRARNV